MSRDNTHPPALPRRLGASLGVGYLTAAVTAVSALVVTPILARKMGMAEFGIWALATSATNYLEVFEFGVGVATTKLLAESIARPESGGDESAVLSSGFFELLRFGILAAAGALILAFGAPHWFDVPPTLAFPTTGAFLLLGCALALSIPLDIFGGGLLGISRYDLSAGVNLIVVLAAGLSSIAIVLLGHGLVMLASATLVISALAHLARWKLLRRHLPELKISKKLVTSKHRRSLRHLSGWFLLRDLSMSAIGQTDLIVAGSLLGVRAAAIFAVATKLSQLVRRGLQPIMLVLFPHAAGLSVAGNLAASQRLLLEGSRFTLLLMIPFSIGLSMLAPQVIQLWVGPSYKEAAPILAVLAVGLGLSAIGGICLVVLGGGAKTKETALILALEASINLLLSILLARSLGMIGIALGTLVALVSVELPLMLRLALSEMRLRLREFVTRVIVPHLAPTLTTTAFLYWASPEPSLGDIVTVSVISGFLYLSVFISQWWTGDAQRAWYILKDLNRRAR